jgi:hypothetical protein
MTHLTATSRSAAISEALDFVNDQPNERIVKLDKARLVLVVRDGAGIIIKISY